MREMRWLHGYFSKNTVDDLSNHYRANVGNNDPLVIADFFYLELVAIEDPSEW